MIPESGLMFCNSKPFGSSKNNFIFVFSPVDNQKTPLSHALLSRIRICTGKSIFTFSNNSASCWINNSISKGIAKSQWGKSNSQLARKSTTLTSYSKRGVSSVHCGQRINISPAKGQTRSFRRTFEARGTGKIKVMI